MTTPTLSQPLHPDLIIALRKAKLHILAHPEMYRQEQGNLYNGSGCLVVHTAHELGGDSRQMGVLDLQDRFCEPRINHLYLRDRWPHELYGDASAFYSLTSFDRAVIGACVIELFILTNGFDELCHD